MNVTIIKYKRIRIVTAFANLVAFKGSVALPSVTYFKQFTVAFLEQLKVAKLGASFPLQSCLQIINLP